MVRERERERTYQFRIELKRRIPHTFKLLQMEYICTFLIPNYTHKHTHTHTHTHTYMHTHTLTNPPEGSLSKKRFSKKSPYRSFPRGKTGFNRIFQKILHFSIIFNNSQPLHFCVGWMVCRAGLGRRRVFCHTL